MRARRLLLSIPLCFTLVLVWFSWSSYHSALPLAEENLRGAGLSIAAAIEQLAAADDSFRSLARYSSPDIAFFALVDRQGIIRFHTNPELVGRPFGGGNAPPVANGIVEQRQRLGTGEEVYVLRTWIHPDRQGYQLVMALHTYRSDRIFQRVKTGITVVAVTVAALWGLTAVLLFMFRREEQHRREMERRRELARLGEMGAVLAHEIRNPLAGIKGFAQLVATTDDSDKAHLYAEKIVAQSLRLEALVTDLLAFSRDDQGERQPVDMAGIIWECAALVAMEASAQKVQLQVEAEAGTIARLVVDRVVQMLLNLMKNAIQAMPDGGVLNVLLRPAGGSVSVSIADTGTGINAEQLPHIFDPFWTTKATGTGLGLALCRRVAEEHGGTLTVESSVGVGTTFLLTIPVAAEDRKQP